MHCVHKNGYTGSKDSVKKIWVVPSVDAYWFQAKISTLVWNSILNLICSIRIMHNDLLLKMNKLLKFTSLGWYLNYSHMP